MLCASDLHTLMPFNVHSPMGRHTIWLYLKLEIGLRHFSLIDAPLQSLPYAEQ